MTSEPTIRPESEADRAAIIELHRLAFGDPQVIRIVERTWAGDPFIPELSLVWDDGEIAGHVLLSRAHVGDEPVLALGPLGVLPERQRQGVGTALMDASIDAARAAGESLIFLLGHPSYYPRFGFVEAATIGVTGAWKGPPFMALPLRADHPRGYARFSSAFDE